MQIVGDPLDVVAGSREVLHAVPEQIIVVGLEVDLAAVLQKLAVSDQLARVGKAVLVGGVVLAPRVAEVDIDAADFVLRGDDALDALDIGAHDLDVVDGAPRCLIGGFDLALGKDKHLIGDVDAQIVIFRVGAGKLRDEAALAAAQLQNKGLLRAGILAVPLAAPDEGFVHMEIRGHQFVVGIGFETHSHSLLFSFKNLSTCSGVAAQLP